MMRIFADKYYSEEKWLIRSEVVRVNREMIVQLKKEQVVRIEHWGGVILKCSPIFIYTPLR